MADLAFGPFALDTTVARLRRQDRDIRLRPQAIRVLEALVVRAGRCVEYDELMAEAWRGVAVSRHTIDVTVAEVRRALAEYGSWVRHRRIGYAFEMPRSDEQVGLGWHLWSLRTREGFGKALACFRDAAVLEPGDFRAYQGQAACHIMLAAYGMLPGRDLQEPFAVALHRAEELVGSTSELRCARGHGLHMFEHRLDEAEFEFTEAARESPGMALPYIGLTTLYATRGRLDAALAAVERARHADALHPALPAAEVSVRVWRREYAAAVDLGARAVAMQPYVVLGRVWYGDALERSGHHDEALAQFQLASIMFGDLPWLRAAVGGCLARMGRLREAHAVLEEIDARRRAEYVDSYQMAIFRQSLGDVEGAFAELDRATAENCGSLYALAVDPKADPLRHDRRFRRILSARQPRGRTVIPSTPRH